MIHTWSCTARPSLLQGKWSGFVRLDSNLYAVQVQCSVFCLVLSHKYKLSRTVNDNLFFISLPLSSSLFLSLPLSPPLFLSLPLSPFLSLSLPLSPPLFLSLPLSPFLSLSLPLSPSLFLSLPLSPPLSPLSLLTR